MIHTEIETGLQVSLNLRSKEPMGEQVYRQLLTMIHEKRLQAGDQLPPVRELADLLKVNFNTIARAYQRLDREGWIITQQGRGSYVVDVAEEQWIAPGYSPEAFLERLQSFIQAEAERNGVEAQDLWAIGFSRQPSQPVDHLRPRHRKRISHRPGWRPYFLEPWIGARRRKHNQK
jgi:GntR family transcriptional regulator